MTRLTLDLPTDLFERLRAEAANAGKPMEAIALEWLARPPVDRSTASTTEAPRDFVTAALRDAGLLTELTRQERRRSSRTTASLDDVRAALDRDSGAPLSELIEEMRGPRE